MELLAPAGSQEALVAAVSFGADAVYIGGKKFSARSGAKNFSDEELEEAVKYCHLHDVKVHVTANTLIKQNEAENFIEYLGFLNRINVDAVIIQDIGMAAIARKLYPDLPLHASTQMTVATLSGVKFLENMGFERVVFARELSMAEIKFICENSSAEIEVFAHGAVCMSYSGQCLMSSIIGGRSGNRGMCAQPCRLPYTFSKGNKKGYLLSTKDMALVDHLDELKSCGVSSIKIEGRLKRPEYVAAVTGIYRKYIDKGGRADNSDVELLLDSFSRSGFSDGYFTGHLGKNMMSYDIPGNTGENKLSRRIDDFLQKPAERKKPIDIFCKMRQGEKLYIKVSDKDGRSAYAESESVVETAVNKPVSRQRLEEQLTKLGDSIFCADNIDIELDDGLILPIKEINAARRTALARLEEEILFVGNRRSFTWEKDEISESKFPKELSVQVETKEQLKACEDMGIKTIYLPKGLSENAQKEGTEYVLILPGICDSEKTEDVPENFGVLISNIAQRELYKGKKQYINYRMNIFNSYAAEEFSDAKSVCLSPELNLKEIAKIKSSTPQEIIAYGRLPLMTMKNCPIKSLNGKCAKGEHFTLRDRKNEEFIFTCDGACHSVLLNSKNLYMADKLNEFEKTDVSRFRLMFFDEDYNKTKKIISEYQKALNGYAADSLLENTFTRGHFFRGVK